MKLGDWIQTAAVVAAVGAAIVALIISRLDRKNAREIAEADRKAARALAEDDRRAALEQQKLMFDLELLQRLAQNLNRGGHTDSDKIKDMGAEAQSIFGLIGPGLLPRNWDNRIALDEEELRNSLADESKPGWLRNAIEVELAIIVVSEQIKQSMNRP